MGSLPQLWRTASAPHLALPSPPLPSQALLAPLQKFSWALRATSNGTSSREPSPSPEPYLGLGQWFPDYGLGIESSVISRDP